MSFTKPIAEPFRRPAPRPTDRDGFNVRQIARAIIRRLPVILVLAVIGGALGLAAQMAFKPLYTSSVSILIDPKRPGSFGADAEFANLYVDSTKIASVVSIIESSELLGPVVKNEGLANDPEFGAPTKSLIREWLSFLPLPKVKPERDDQEAREARALARLTRAMRVNRFGLTYVLTVDVTARNPETAQRLAGAIADSYIKDQVDSKGAVTQRDSAWLAGRLTDLRRDLVRNESAVEAIRQKYGLTETDHGPGSTVDRQSITELNDQLLQAQGQVAATQARWQQVEHLQKTGGNLEALPEVTSSHVVEELRKQQADAVRRIAPLQTHYTANYPDLLYAKQDLRAIETAISAEVSRIVATYRNEYETSLARRDALSARLHESTVSEGGSASSAGRLELREAQRIVEASKGLYESLLNRWRDVELQQRREEPEARVISQPTVPDSPSFPKPYMFPATGVVLGLLLGLGITVLLPKLEGRFVNVVDIERLLSLPVLGTVPLLQRKDLAFAQRKLSIVDYIARKPISRFAEGLRALRVSLGISGGGTCRVVQLTSAVPGEGKSTVAAALAVSAASAGIRTVIVDADVRYSSVDRMFGLRRHEGLVDIVRGGAAIGAVVQERKNLPLSIITAGSTIYPQPDLVSSHQFNSLVKELTRRYDLVILDSPPVLAVSDALAIASIADVTLLVVEWRGTPKEVVDHAVKALRGANAPLAGVLLNKIDPAKISTYEYGYAGADRA